MCDNNAPRLLSVKIALAGEIHRFRVDFEIFTFDLLRQFFLDTFPNDLKFNEDFIVQYKDNEGDIVTVTSDLEFMEACRVFLKLSGNNESRSLFFFATKKTLPCAFNENVIQPIVQAVEEFAQVVSAAAIEMSQKVDNAEWSDKCRQRAENAGKAIHKTALETQRFLADNGQRLSETEFANQVKEFAEDVKKSMAELFKETLDQQTPSSNDVVVTTEARETVPTPASVDSSNQEEKEGEKNVDVQEEIKETNTEEESSAVTVEIENNNNSEIDNSKEDEEWDVVSPTSSTNSFYDVAADVAVEENVVVETGEKEKESQNNRRWETEFKVITDMLGDAYSYEQCEDLLTKCNGDLQIVMNSLMDM